MTAIAGSIVLGGVSGCLGSDDGVDVPESDIVLVDHHEDPPTVAVQYTGEEITTENSQGIQILFSRPGQDDEPLLDDWRPPVVEGDQKDITGNPGYFQSGDAIRFIWISADGEFQGELDVLEIP